MFHIRIRNVAVKRRSLVVGSMVHLLDRERIKCFLEVMKEDCVRRILEKQDDLFQSRARYVRICGIHMRRKGLTPFP